MWVLGKAGFRVVHRQIQETTDHYRTVKEIDKRVPHKLDYSSEFLVMAISAKVCFLSPKGSRPGSLLLQDILVPA